VISRLDDWARFCPYFILEKLVNMRAATWILVAVAASAIFAAPVTGEDDVAEKGPSLVKVRRNVHALP
jgi:hypothetical protein